MHVKVKLCLKHAKIDRCQFKGSYSQKHEVNNKNNGSKKKRTDKNMGKAVKIDIKITKIIRRK